MAEPQCGKIGLKWLNSRTIRDLPLYWTVEWELFSPLFPAALAPMGEFPEKLKKSNKSQHPNVYNWYILKNPRRFSEAWWARGGLTLSFWRTTTRWATTFSTRPTPPTSTATSRVGAANLRKQATWGQTDRVPVQYKYYIYVQYLHTMFIRPLLDKIITHPSSLSALV